MSHSQILKHVVLAACSGLILSIVVIIIVTSSCGGTVRSRPVGDQQNPMYCVVVSPSSTPEGQ